MNRHLHRIVFNAARGMRMVVQETATSTGKGSNKATTVVGSALAGVAAFAAMLVGAALAGMLTAPSVHAQIVGAPNNPINQAQAEQGRNAVGAFGLIVGVPLAAAFGLPAFIGAGVTAQTTSLVGGVSGVAGTKWVGSVVGGGFMGGVIEGVTHFNTATPASLGMAALGGAVGGPVKLGWNAYFGLANQWLPTRPGNIGIWYLSSQFAATPVREIGQSAVDVNGNTSWWNTPLFGCKPSPEKPC